MAVKKYESERLNALLGQPERAVEADEAQAIKSGLLVKLGKREQGRLERGLAARTLADLLFLARPDSGLSVRKVAERLHKHPSRVGAIERGSPDLAFRTFVEYAHSLGYSVEVKLVPGDRERKSLSASLPQTRDAEEAASAR
jgi:transcriptional regulator with XRE-family HTH domain